MNKNWNIEELKKALTKNKEIKFWIIEKENTQRLEKYFLINDLSKIEVDQSRSVNYETVSIKLGVYLSDDKFHGEISKKIFRNVTLDKQINDAIEDAKKTKHQSWNLPEKFIKEIPNYKSADPAIAEDIEKVANELENSIKVFTTECVTSTFNSSELFLSLHDREIILSNDVKHRYKQTRIYLETAFSGKNDEYLETQWSVAKSDIDVKEFIKKASTRALLLDNVNMPETGKYSVLIDADVLAAVFNSILPHLSGANLYNQLPFSKPGDEFIPGANGDKYTVKLNPNIDFGADSVGISLAGVIQEPRTLVENNIVKLMVMDQQYASYLNLEPTVSRGSIELSLGEYTYDELLSLDDKVIEILQFSGLFIDGNSGTFSSEIRLAKLVDNKTNKVSYLKGGSLSGSFKENFKFSRSSKKATMRSSFQTGSTQGQGYFGPEYVLLSNVSIVGA